ncbi:FAM40A-like protein [Sarcoptes scabiei]|uniref:FAM40A-like protein n=1 Tax=Sarcoptes scabiei TaxID=52283 RepID=A0A131ZVH3_SARSC|nr:FAM40A-like protein [Sarcoptes scabiei]
MTDSQENFNSSSEFFWRKGANCPSPSNIDTGTTTKNEYSTLDFQYDDTDRYGVEIAELYSYSEETDFGKNKISFECLMEDSGYPLKWTHMTADQKHRAIERMAEGIEFTDRSNRTRAIRAFLYLCQGNFGDCETIEEQPKYARENLFYFYDYGLFLTFIQLIHFEMEQSNKLSNLNSSSNNDHHVPLRLLLNIVYLFVQEMLVETKTDTEQQQKLRQQFKDELMQPIRGELLHITLFDMLLKHCNGQGPKYFPTKKTLLLLWKILLLTLGGNKELSRLKNLYRQRAGLKPVPDETLEVTKRMFPVSPPPTAIEMIDSSKLNPRKLNRPFKRQTVVKQSSFGYESFTPTNNFNYDNNPDDDENLNDDAFEPPNNENGTDGHETNDLTENFANENEEIYGPTNLNIEKVKAASENARQTESIASQYSEDDTATATPIAGSPRSSSPIPEEFARNRNHPNLSNIKTCRITSKSLPWQPKVRQKDIEQFFFQVRRKFVGFTLPDDFTTTAGLPAPILESIEVLKKHLYHSLGEFQIKREEELAKYPLTKRELDDESMTSFAEQLYHTMLPSLPLYLIALLKLLLGAVSNLKTKNDSQTVPSEIIPLEQSSSIRNSMKIKIDLDRHHEIIIKAISGIMILLLKHYKINHIYQFEYICQQFMFANCIPLIIKFLTLEMPEFIESKNSIPIFDFPACCFHEQDEHASDMMELWSFVDKYSWRNMFSAINLLQILNKITKWKNSRIIMLVIFKSAQPLKRALRVRHALFQLYVLKLLKIQAKFLGRQWRKSNMKILSDIYAKVRHRLHDDWAFATEVETKAIYVQTEEFLLQANINRFHNRRYKRPFPNNSNSIPSSLSTGTVYMNGVKLSDYILSNGSNESSSPSLTNAANLNGIPDLINQSTSTVSNTNGNSIVSNGPVSGHNINGLCPQLVSIADEDLFKPIDNNLLSVLNREVKLTDEFKKNYEIWLEREVFQYKINWDDLLDDPNSVVEVDRNILDYIDSMNQITEDSHQSRSPQKEARDQKDRQET